jgi:hypothetical protein
MFDICRHAAYFINVVMIYKDFKYSWNINAWKILTTNMLKYFNKVKVYANYVSEGEPRWY